MMSMNKQRGRISNSVITLIVAAVIGLICFGSYWSASNYGNKMEAQLDAARDDSKSVFAQYGQKVQEAVQLPEMYTDDLARVTREAIQGRYGEGGSKAVVQWIQEQNPNLDPKLYLQVQQIIEAGRTNFENAQRRVIDVRRQYKTALGSFWYGKWLSLAGYPKVDLKEYDIVSTVRADEAFKNRKEDGSLQLRKKPGVEE